MTKKLIGAALLAAMGTTMLFAQSAMRRGKNTATEQEIRKLETSLWQAWKDHNAKPFEEHLTPDSIDLGTPPERGKANILKSITTARCQVKSFSLSGFAYSWLDDKSVIVTYVGTQDATCNGKKVPEKVNASSVWVKRGNKWLTPFHQESPAM
jgi:Domain of unknown function (DUF4440)